jgi:hypothetical protein
MHPNRDDPRAFLFQSSTGTAFGVGNYLKRYLKPLAERAGVSRCDPSGVSAASSTEEED